MKPRSVPLALLLSMSLLPMSSCETGGPDGELAGEPAPAPPVEYSTYIVYVADGTYDPADPNWDPVTLDELERDDWGWSDSRSAEFEDESKEFFLQRFGVDVDDPANEGRMRFIPVVLEPRARYRVVTMSDRYVPPEGWLLSDGAWQVHFDDPDGYELGGEFQGYVAPPGAFLTYGYYQIEAHDSDPIIIGFKSFSPLFSDDTGLGVFRCELWSDDFGTGVGHGVFRQYQTPNGDVTFDIRNVLTFE